MRLKSMLSMATLLLLAGCQRALHVSVVKTALAPDMMLENHDSLKTLPGLPSYVRIGACKLTTVWLERQHEITFENPDKSSPTVVVSHNSFIMFRLDGNSSKLKENLVNGPFSLEQLQGAIKANPTDVYLSTNMATLDSVPDYSRTFYVNSARPLTGSAQVSTKVGADGTITDASAQVQDQTFSTIASIVTGITSKLSTPFYSKAGSTEYTEKEHLFAHTFIIYRNFDKTDSDKADPVKKANLGCIAENGGLKGSGGESYSVAELDRASSPLPSNSQTPAPAKPNPNPPPISSRDSVDIVH